MRLAAWTDHNLTIQGYCLGPQERRRLAVGLRFTTGLCLALVITGVAIQSPEDTRRKAAKFGAMGSTTRATKPEEA
jgi:hypothetical protein